MPEHTITLDEEAYEELEAQRRDEESFSDVVHRLLGPGPAAPSLDPDDGETMEDVAETAGDEDVELEEG